MCKILGARGRKEGTRRVQEGRKMMRIVGRSAIAWLAGFWLAAVARQVLVARNGLRPAVACRPRGVVCTNYACPLTCNLLAFKKINWYPLIKFFYSPLHVETMF
jgi:hypothetical protein